jgi:hypothetical protein
MAEIVTGEEATRFKESATAGPGRPTLYPWHVWLDGKVWRLQRGVDFDIAPKSIQTIARRAAAQRDLRVHIRKSTTPDSFLIWAVPLSQEGQPHDLVMAHNSDHTASEAALDAEAEAVEAVPDPEPESPLEPDNVVAFPGGVAVEPEPESESLLEPDIDEIPEGAIVTERNPDGSPSEWHLPDDPPAQEGPPPLPDDMEAALEDALSDSVRNHPSGYEPPEGWSL